MWYRQAISVDVRTGRFFHVGHQRRMSFCPCCSDQLGGRKGRKVTQEELLGWREPKRHWDVVNDDPSEAGTREKVAEVVRVAERDGGRTTGRRLRANV